MTLTSTDPVEVPELPMVRFLPNERIFADIPLLRVNKNGQVRFLRGRCDVQRGMTERMTPGITYGIVCEPAIEVVELVAVGEMFVDPRMAWVHRFGDEAYDTKTVQSYRRGVARLLSHIDKAIDAGWWISASTQDYVVIARRT